MDSITWDNLSQVVVLGTVVALFMQFIGKGLLELALCLLLRLVFGMSNEEVAAWPGRSPIYFAFMLLVGFGLLLWRGIDSGPAFITALVAMVIASGEYEFIKSGFRASGKKLVPSIGPLGYKWH